MTLDILIVYTSNYGNTQKMAESARDGAASVEDVEVALKTVEQTNIDDVRASDVLIIGTPIRHRSADAKVKKFIEDTLEILWLKDEMVGKVGAVFSVGGGYGSQGAGVEITQLGILGAMAACGMIFPPLPKTTPGSAVAGSHWGAHGRSGGLNMEPDGVTDEMLEAAYHHAANTVRLAKALQGHPIFATGNKAPSDELIKMFAGGM